MFKERLKKLRESKKLTQSELATALNIGRASISNYELGTRTPDIDTLVKISDYFNVTTDYLTGKSNFRTIEDEYMYRKNNKLLESDYDDIDEKIREFISLQIKIINNTFVALFYYDKTYNQSTLIKFSDSLGALTTFFNKSLKEIRETEPMTMSEYINKFQDSTKDKTYTSNDGIKHMDLIKEENILEPFIFNKKIQSNERAQLNNILDDFENSVRSMLFKKLNPEFVDALYKALKDRNKH